MKRVELKRVLETLGKGTSPDEKTPFAAQGTLPNNGSFTKTLDSEDDIKKSKEFSENEGDDALSGPMSMQRKFCFVMSFNFWILYFLALGWLIPCRNLECTLPYSDVVETNLSSIWLLTNLETTNVKGLPSLAMIGYGNGTEWKLSALEAFDATYLWDNSLPFIPRKIQCNFGNTFDVNGDGIPDCLVLGFNDLYAFNASDGYVFWHQSMPSEEGNILSSFHPTTTHRNGENYLIGTCGGKLVIVNARNGSKVSDVRLPCEAPFEIKIVSSKNNESFAPWNLICDYGDKVEAWSFKEEDVLNDEKNEKDENISKFALLFSGTNSGGSIDLDCDVTLIPGGSLLLSWSDRVVMVTQNSTAWERYFPEPLTVANIEEGHFSNSKEILIAAAVHNSTNTMIYIMEPKNGTIVDSILLQDRQALSMEKITDDVDLLVLKSRLLNYTSVAHSNFTDPIPTEQTNFALIDFSSGKLTIRDILTTSVVLSSALNRQRNGETDLLVMTTKNGFTSYLKYILHDVVSKDNVICLGGNKHSHHYPLEA